MCHPLLFLAPLADLQYERFQAMQYSADRVLTLALALMDLGHEKNATARYPDADYDRLSLEALQSYMISGDLSRSLPGFKKQVARIRKDVIEFGRDREITGEVVSLEKSRESLHNHLEVTLEKIDDLIEKSRITANTASLLMSAIANLVSQKETRINRALTAESAKIAKATKADSAAMKVIAVMTMFFLPATYTSASAAS
jgi:hypothetical protein